MKNFFKNFSLMGFLMFMMCLVLGVGDVSGAVCADASALTPSGSGVAGQSDVNNVQTTNEVSASNPNTTGGMTTAEIRANANANIASLIHDPVDQKIVQIRPYANPIDTLLRYANAETINNLEFGYYSIGTRPCSDKTTAAADVTTGKSATKTSVYATVKVSDASLFDVTDTINVIADSGAKLQLYVYKKDTTNGLYVTCSEDQLVQDGGYWEVPAFGGTGASAATLYIMGRAGAEKDVTTPPLGFLPEKKIGYCQIFMAQIEQNTYEKMADKEVKFDLSEVEENALFEYRSRMEGTWLLGRQSKIYDPEKRTYIYQTGGLLNSITKHHTIYAGAADGNAEIVDLAKKVFKGNNGSKIRFAICGSDAMARLSKLQGIERKQDAVQTEVVYGITWSKMVTNFGQINMVLHEQLDQYGLSDTMIIVDPEFLKMKRVKGFERNQVDGREHLITNGDIVVFSETVGLAVYNPDVHCIVTVSEEAAAESSASV